MVYPSLTVTYLALLALLFAGLSLVVVAQRARKNVPFGDADDDALRRAVRAHGNFAEWVPIALLLCAALEMRGADASLMHGLLGALLAARIAHPVAFASPVDTIVYRLGRIFGALTTFLVVVVAAVLLLIG